MGQQLTRPLVTPETTLLGVVDEVVVVRVVEVVVLVEVVEEEVEVVVVVVVDVEVVDAILKLTILLACLRNKIEPDEFTVRFRALEL
jgi:hypothetical protein